MYRRSSWRDWSSWAGAVEIDFSIFRAVAELLYSGPWVAERWRRFESFSSRTPTRCIRWCAASSEERAGIRPWIPSKRNTGCGICGALQKRSGSAWTCWCCPPRATIYTHEEIAGDPVGRNTNLGYYTNFVNLLDLAAVAAPGGFRPDGLPFGISFIGPAFSDEALLALADRFSAHADVAGRASIWPCPPGCIAVAVVGAHLTGQPLNRQLTERGARLLKAPHRAVLPVLCARWHQPPKPGLVREEGFQGPGIEVEVWAVPEHQFGGFVAACPRRWESAALSSKTARL